MSNRMQSIRLKSERAKEHFRNLEVARDRFINSEPYRIVSEFDPQTSHKTYKVVDLKVPPADIGLIAGDVLHNLRSALDHLAWQLVLANGGTPNKITCFPIYDDAAKYVTGSARQVKGMAQAAIDAIDASKPYKGGDGAGLWVLHYLDIADKHHELLVTTVNVTRASFTTPGYWEPGYTGVGHIALPRIRKPLKDGDIIAIRESDMDDEMDFALDIAFAEPEVIKGKPIIETIKRLSDVIDNLLTDFEPLLV